MKTEDDFDNKYTMDYTVKSIAMCPESQIGMLETYGEDYEEVKRIYEQNPMRVWTVVDCDDGVCISQGLHYVNRIYYMITVEPAESEDEYYMIELYNENGELEE